MYNTIFKLVIDIGSPTTGTLSLFNLYAHLESFIWGMMIDLVLTAKDERLESLPPIFSSLNTSCTIVFSVIHTCIIH